MTKIAVHNFTSFNAMILQMTLRIMFELHIVVSCVYAVLRKKFVMRTALFNAVGVDNYDLVGVSYC